MSDFSTQADRAFLDTSSSPDRVDEWSPERARLLGSLIEKALATPQNYPLSVNALVAACNQTTNRDPIMDLTEGAVEGLLAEAKADGWVRFVHPRSGRGVTKYRHVVDETLELDEARTALIGVLALRGPQTVGELRTRTERLAPMDDATVDRVLTELSQRRPRPLVRRLAREPGHREQRWIQLLCPAQGEERAGQPASAPASPRRPPASSGGDGDETDSLREELAAVKAELATTRAELAELRAAFEAFRQELA
jgi:uncharacterized protein YceH (UPF0502 family)